MQIKLFLVSRTISLIYSYSKKIQGSETAISEARKITIYIEQYEKLSFKLIKS